MDLDERRELSRGDLETLRVSGITRTLFAENSPQNTQNPLKAPVNRLLYFELWSSSDSSRDASAGTNKNKGRRIDSVTTLAPIVRGTMSPAARGRFNAIHTLQHVWHIERTPRKIKELLNKTNC
jgi:hypothetical protein